MFRNPVTDLIVVLVVALLIFGPKRLPMLGRSLGQGLKEFKDSIGGNSKEDDDDRPALNAAQAPAAAQAPSAADTQPVQAPAPSPPAAQAPATSAPPAAAAAQPPRPPEQESAEVASSEQRS
jgi:TatA/E family protein of Tat protein translocase